MDHAQPTKLGFLAVPAAPYSIGILVFVLVVLAAIGPWAVVDSILNVSLPIYFYMSLHIG